MSIDTRLVITALERAKAEQDDLADCLHAAHDYNAEWPAHEAHRLGEAIQLVQQRDQLLAAANKLEARGFFAENSCADASTNADMAEMRDAIAAAKGGSA